MSEILYWIVSICFVGYLLYLVIDLIKAERDLKKSIEEIKE